MSPLRMLRPLAPLAALALLLGASPAWAVCTYNTLTSDGANSTNTSPTLYQFTQANAYWSAVGVRPAPGEDWDITVYGATAADPACVASPLASSNLGGSAVDLVIGDFNHDALGTYYPSASRFSGSSAAAVQWDDGPDLLSVNGTPVTQSLIGSDLLRVYDVYLTAGTPYSFDFYPEGGSGLHLLLFRNTSGGTYWAGRSSALFDVTGPALINAPTTGYYGVVVVNDLGAYATYALGVTASACGIPTTLTAGVTTTVAPSNGHFAFDAEEPFWMGCAVRPTSGDWDIAMYGLPSGAAAPVCFSTLLGNSALGGSVVDVTMGDFNHTPLGWYYAYATMFAGGANAQVQATGNSGVVVVNNDAIDGTLAATDLAQERDVYLVAGRTYALTFFPSAGVTLLLFANTAQGAYVAGRSSAAVTTTTSTTYLAPVTGWYGLVVVNDGAVAGSYELGVGDCSAVTPLAAGVATGTGGTENAYFSFAQSDEYWTAVAVRNTSVDWDLVVDQDNAASPAPECTTTGLAGSADVPPLQDFVVGDFNFNAPGTYYAHAHQYTSGATVPAQVQWDSGSDVIWPNDNNFTTRATGPNDVIGCWDILLTAGQTYSFSIFHGGGADVKLLLFRNALSGTYWAGRASAEFSTTSTQTYTAAATAWYGVVAVNDNGVADSYNIGVATCDPVVTLPAAPAGLNTGYLPVLFGSFTQPSPYWTPVAVAAVNPSEDWDIAGYSSATGGAIGTCESGLLAYSTHVSGYTDYVVGDFNYVPTGTNYVRADRFFGIGSANVQFYPGNHSLVMNGAHEVYTVPSTFLVQSWDALLTAGQTYSVFFSHDPGLNAKVDVFKSTGGVYWGARGTAMLEATHSASFVATSSGYYGIVVVSDGGAGTFNIGIGTGYTAVDDASRPDRDALRGVSPNPGRAGLQFQFALHDGGDVTFDVIDMAGRRVSRFEPGTRSAGEWAVAWPATDASGRPLAPGLYFVRMRLGERTVGTSKVTLLE